MPRTDRPTSRLQSRRGRGHLGAVAGTAIAVAFAVCVGLWGPRLGDRAPLDGGVPLGGAVAALGRMHREVELAPTLGLDLDWRREIEETIGWAPPHHLADPELAGWRAEAVLRRRVPAFAGGGEAVTVRFARGGEGEPRRRASLSFLADRGRIAAFDRFGRLRPLGDGQTISIDPSETPESLAVRLWGEGPVVAAVQADEIETLVEFEAALEGEALAEGGTP
jgi:hypothetical protein